MQNFICLVYLMRILLHLSTYFPNTPRRCTEILLKVNELPGSYAIDI